MSRAFDLNIRVEEATVCGMSSRKGEIVDLHRRVLGARAAGKEKGRRNECGDQENGAEGAGTPFGT